MSTIGHREGDDCLTHGCVTVAVGDVLTDTQRDGQLVAVQSVDGRTVTVVDVIEVRAEKYVPKCSTPRRFDWPTGGGRYRHVPHE